MVELKRRKDAGVLRIRTKEGVNITAFLDHIEDCGHCRRAEGALVGEFNGVIGGEVEFTLWNTPVCEQGVSPVPVPAPSSATSQEGLSSLPTDNRHRRREWVHPRLVGGGPDGGGVR